MFLLALIWIPALISISYSMFGWFGPIASAVIVGWFFLRNHQNNVKWRASNREHSRREEANSKNSSGHRKPKGPRSGRYSGRYKSPYSNWRTVAKREKYLCHICGSRVDDDDFTRSESGSFIAGPEYPTVDHLVPQSKGGSHHWTNLKLAHKRCNSLKSNRDNWQDLDIDPFED